MEIIDNESDNTTQIYENITTQSNSSNSSFNNGIYTTISSIIADVTIQIGNNSKENDELLYSFDKLEFPEIQLNISSNSTDSISDSWHPDRDEHLRNFVNLNEEYKHGTVIMTFSHLVLVTFIFYVPRIIYYRLSRSSTDRQLPGYFLLWYLSLIACIAGVIHFANFQLFVTSSTEFNSTIFDEQLSTFFLLKASTASINRMVSPIVALVCIQQIATHSQFSILILQETAIHVISCLIVTVLVFGYSFLKEYFVMSSFDLTTKMYPDPIHVDSIDVISPLVTALFFFFAKQNLSRQSVYSLEKCGPSGPTTLDKISKVVVFQTVMVFFTLGAILFAPSEEQELNWDQEFQNWQFFMISAQTPVVHWVLFRSLLRTRKSTRLCFLMCFGKEEKVETETRNDVEMGQQQRNNDNRNMKNEEDEEEEEEEEAETLDANKIVILPASQLEEPNRREVFEMRVEDVMEERRPEARRDLVPKNNNHDPS